jgi:pyruvate formate lyase activating enzyme
MGEHKWQELGLPYELTDVMPPTAEVIERVRNQFRQRGIFTC